MSTPTTPSLGSNSSKFPFWFAAIGCLAVLVYFFGFFPAYGPSRTGSIFRELFQSWNEENRFEHGPIYPVIIVGLLLYKWKSIRESVSSGETYGLIMIVIGVLCYLISYRVIQWRIGVGALPFLVSGMIWFLWGRKTFVITAFPVFYICLAVPLPDMQQATVPLQNISVKISQALCSLCGVETYAQGANIFSTNKNWEPLHIAELCSGIRSLMALFMISSAWAYIARIDNWKKILLLLSAIPLSIIGNGLRVASIFIIAEYGDQKFARGTWHDNSGLLLFYPISLGLMMLLHATLEGWRPWKRSKVKRTLVQNATPTL